jgi:hypothetical protein
MKKIFSAVLILCAMQLGFSQKLTLDKVVSANIKNAGAIKEGNLIKGYYVFYESDKIDRKTREYTIQILDQNINATKKATFQDSKEIDLVDAEFNETSLCFFFLNQDKRKYLYKIFDLEGKLKYEYEKEYDKGDFWLFDAQRKMIDPDGEGQSNTLIAIPGLGFASLMPVRQNGANIFEIGYYSSVSNKEYVYRPEFEERQVFPMSLGVVDSTLFLEVGKRKRLLSGQPKTTTYAFNVVTQKKVFELEDNFDGKYRAMPTYMQKEEGTNNLLMVASYFDEADNISKDYGQGIAMYTMTTTGRLISKQYNPWQGTFSKFIPVNEKGKIDNIGYLSIQKIIKAADGKVFVMSEGYKRNFNLGGAAFSLLSGSGQGFTKMVVTDIVVMEYDNSYKLTNAKVYTKTPEDYSVPGGDYLSQHSIAAFLKQMGAFGYDFTTTNKDNSSFSFCYSDYEKTKEYKGSTFNSLHYSNGKFTTDKIQLTTKASSMAVFPAKQGYVGIYEYFKKEKRIEFRLEKMN